MEAMVDALKFFGAKSHEVQGNSQGIAGLEQGSR